MCLGHGASEGHRGSVKLLCGDFGNVPVIKQPLLAFSIGFLSIWVSQYYAVCTY